MIKAIQCISLKLFNKGPVDFIRQYLIRFTLIGFAEGLLYLSAKKWKKKKSLTIILVIPQVLIDDQLLGFSSRNIILSVMERIDAISCFTILEGKWKFCCSGLILTCCRITYPWGYETYEMFSRHNNTFTEKWSTTMYYPTPISKRTGKTVSKHGSTNLAARRAEE